MNWLDGVRYGIEVATFEEAAPEAAPKGSEEHGRRRVRVPKLNVTARASQTEVTYSPGQQNVLPPPRPDILWRDMDLDSQTFKTLPIERIVELLADISPEVSAGLWNFLRMCNPGWEFDVLKKKGGASDKAGKEALEGFIDQLKTRYGSVDAVFNRLFMSAYIRGAFYSELTLSRAGRQPIDIATPDPKVARFREVDDPDYGRSWLLGYWRRGEFVDLSVYETVRYIPIDPLPDQPYGRAIMGSSIFPAIFLLSMLHDLRRVVQQQGYPRIDITVDIEEIMKSMPETERDDPAAVREWISESITQVQEIYYRLQPDDAYIHVSGIKVNRPVGAIDSSSLGAVSTLVSVIERMIVRGLKTMPLLLGISEATSETHANRQWEISTSGIRALQHLAESLLEYLFGLALRAKGVSGVVVFRFAELRKSEELRDEQTRQLATQNAYNAYTYGWLTQDDASMHVWKKKAAEKEPLKPAAPSNAVPADVAAAETAAATDAPPATESPSANTDPTEKKWLSSSRGNDRKG